MADGVPEPGSVLSLISNKNIRYEGTLVAIDMESESPSLRLKAVRSFGTEGRGAAHEYRAPSNEIFSDILFRGSDIVFLEVCSYFQPPKETPQQGVVVEQAGVSSQPVQASQLPRDTGLALPESTMWGSLQNTYAPPSDTWSHQPPQSQGWQQYQGPPGIVNAAPQVAAPAPAPMVLVTPSAPHKPPQAQAVYQPQPPPKSRAELLTQPAAPLQTGTTGAAVNIAAPPGFNALGAPSSQEQKKTAETPVIVVQQPVPVYAPAPGLAPILAAPQAAPQLEIARAGGRYGAQSAAGAPVPGRGRGRSRGRGRGRISPEAGRGPAVVPVPQEDFNFAEGLSKFDKDQTKTESGIAPEVEEIEAGGIYNKDDFFDALSSDLKDKLATGEPQRRPRLSERRQVDMETFGGSGLSRKGMGRGRRGRLGGVNPYATGREHLEGPPQERQQQRGRGRGRGRGRYSDAGRQVIPVQ